MSLDLVPRVAQPIQILIEYEHSEMVSVSSNSALVDHFLAKVKMSQARLTWINYAHDLKVFFHTIQQPLEAVNRQSCVRFMEAQSQAGLSILTINRRLAAISSLFVELNLLDPEHFPLNPVAPLKLRKGTRQKSQSLYRRQPDRVPDVIAEEDLQAFFTVLPTWRDRTLILLMWISCLRIGEAYLLNM